MQLSVRLNTLQQQYKQKPSCILLRGPVTATWKRPPHAVRQPVDGVWTTSGSHHESTVTIKCNKAMFRPCQTTNDVQGTAASMLITNARGKESSVHTTQLHWWKDSWGRKRGNVSQSPCTDSVLMLQDLMFYLNAWRADVKTAVQERDWSQHTCYAEARLNHKSVKSA